MLNRNFADVTARIAAMHKPKFEAIQTPDLGMQFAQAMRAYQDKKEYDEQEANKTSLAEAIRGGNPEEIRAAAAKYDADLGLQYFMNDQAKAQEFERQKELADYNHALDMKKQDALYRLKGDLELINGGTGTAAQQNIAHLQGLGYSPEESAMMVFGGQNPTLNLSNLGKKGVEAYDKKVGEDLAARQKEAREAGEEYEQVTSDINRIKELLPEAKTQEFIDRKTPTMFFDDKTQEARGALRNMLGGLRLDQMKYMKGAISDTEQQFLSDVVSGDLTKYTPPEIVGTLSSIEYKAKRIKDKFAQQTAIPQQNNDPFGIR